MGLYSGYPVTAASWRRKLRRDAVGNSGWKNLKGLLFALAPRPPGPIALTILAWQVVLFVGLWRWPGTGGSTRCSGCCPG